MAKNSLPGCPGAGGGRPHLSAESGRHGGLNCLLNPVGRQADPQTSTASCDIYEDYILFFKEGEFKENTKKRD